MSADKKDKMPQDMNLDEIVEHLESFIDQWGLATRMARREKRLNSSLAELDDFYAAMVPFMETIIESMNQFPVNDIPGKYRSLAFAVFAMCEIDAPVTKWRKVKLDFTSNPRHGVGKRSFYERRMPASTREAWSERVEYEDEGEGPLLMF